MSRVEPGNDRWIRPVELIKGGARSRRRHLAPGEVVFEVAKYRINCHLEHQAKMLTNDVATVSIA